MTTTNEWYILGMKGTYSNHRRSVFQREYAAYKAAEASLSGDELADGHIFLSFFFLGSKANDCRKDGLTLGGKVGFVLGHYIDLCALGGMEVAGLPLDDKSCGGKFIQAEVKQALVVGFEI